MWMSSDEIDVSAEEEVFDIIRTWTGCRKSERSKYFAELFREVRLVYVSRDYLHSDVMTNDLVSSNDGCMALVKDALKFSDCKNNYHYTVMPRKSLETPVIVICMKDDDHKDNILCYSPREDKWSMFKDTVPSKNGIVTSCRGKLYFLSHEDKRILLYNPYSICWRSLPLEEQWKFRKLFVRNEDEIYAFVAETRPCPECEREKRHWRKLHPPLRTLRIIKKKPEANSWDRVLSFEEDSIEGICVVFSNTFVYFIGGTALRNRQKRTLADAGRYDMISNTWHKIADIQEPRHGALGAAGDGRIFIAGGHNGTIDLENCEVYHEATNEWHFIASLRDTVTSSAFLLCVDSKLYLLNRFLLSWRYEKDGIIECYDPDKNEWEEKTRIPAEMIPSLRSAYKDNYLSCCSARFYRGNVNFFQNATTIEEAKRERGKEKRKCAVM